MQSRKPSYGGLSWVALFGLVVCNLIWAANPVMGKILLERFVPLQVTWLRYTSAWIALIAVMAFNYFTARVTAKARPLPRDVSLLSWYPTRRKEIQFLLLLGLLSFFIGPLLQTTGLAASQATDNALIIAMEPLITVILAALLLPGEKLLPLHALTFGLGMLGFCFLAGLTPAVFSEGLSPHLVGNALILVSLLAEGLYSVWVRKLVGQMSGVGILVCALAVGVAALSVTTGLTVGFDFLFELGATPGPGVVDVGTTRIALALFWLGPLGTAATYYFWLYVLQHASVASMALTLFIQPVFGAVLGQTFLNEKLDVGQWVGAGLILLSIICQQIVEGRIRTKQGPQGG